MMKSFTAMAVAPQPPHPFLSSTASLRWPLRNPATSMPPMHYRRPEEMTDLRMKSATESTTQQAQNNWMNNVPETISTIFNKDDTGFSQLQYDYTIPPLAILLLGHNYTDEAHSLVTPYSWPEEIYTSYGPVRYTTSDSGVVSVATYIHSLVHRKEGWNVGELGMVGWSNADYWGNAWRRPFMQHDDLQVYWKEPIAEIQTAIRNLTKDHPAGREWCSQHLPEILEMESNSELSWDPRGLHGLCAQVTKDDGENVNEDLLVFAEKAVEAELRVLLAQCVRLAGYDAACCSNKD